MLRVRCYACVGGGEVLEQAEQGVEDRVDGRLAELDEGGAGDVEDVIVGEGVAVGACSMRELR